MASEASEAAARPTAISGRKLTAHSSEPKGYEHVRLSVVEQIQIWVFFRQMAGDKEEVTMVVVLGCSRPCSSNANPPAYKPPLKTALAAACIPASCTLPQNMMPFQA